MTRPTLGKNTSKTHTHQIDKYQKFASSRNFDLISAIKNTGISKPYVGVLRGVEWVHGLFLFPLVLGKM